LASYEVFQAGQTDNSIGDFPIYESGAPYSSTQSSRSSHCYGAARCSVAAWSDDNYWGRGSPWDSANPIALQIVSTRAVRSPSSIEYVFGSEIPSEVAEDALIRLLNVLATRQGLKTRLTSCPYVAPGALRWKPVGNGASDRQGGVTRRLARIYSEGAADPGVGGGDLESYDRVGC